MTPEQQAVHDDWDVIFQNEFNSPGSDAGVQMNSSLLANGFDPMSQSLIDYFNDWTSNITPTDFIELIKWVWRKLKELAEWLWNKLND